MIGKSQFAVFGIAGILLPCVRTQRLQRPRSGRSIMRSSQLRTLSIHRKSGKVTHGIGLVTDGEELEFMSLDLPCSLSNSTIEQQLSAMLSDLSLCGKQRDELQRAIHIRTVK